MRLKKNVNRTSVNSHVSLNAYAKAACRTAAFFFSRGPMNDYVNYESKEG